MLTTKKLPLSACLRKGVNPTWRGGTLTWLLVDAILIPSQMQGAAWYAACSGTRTQPLDTANLGRSWRTCRTSGMPWILASSCLYHYIMYIFAFLSWNFWHACVQGPDGASLRKGVSVGWDHFAEKPHEQIACIWHMHLFLCGYLIIWMGYLIMWMDHHGPPKKLLRSECTCLRPGLHRPNSSSWKSCWLAKGIDTTQDRSPKVWPRHLP